MVEVSPERGVLLPVSPEVEAVMPRSAIIDLVTFTINRTGSSRSRSRTNTDRILAIRSRWRFDGGRLDSRRSRSIPGRN